jgi:hypothetical protein
VENDHVPEVLAGMASAVGEPVVAEPPDEEDDAGGFARLYRSVVPWPARTGDPARGGRG